MATVLIAEDEVDLALLWRDALVNEGHDVKVVHDGAAAVEAMKQEKFDAIIADFVMPEKGGLVVGGMARVFQDQPRVILVSGKMPNVASVDPADIARQLGIERVLPKPVDLDDLIEAIGPASSQL